MTPAASQSSVVVGLGRSGIGAARLLRASGHHVIVIESADNPELQSRAVELRSEGIEVRLGTPLRPDTFTSLPEPVSSVVISPGIRWDHPVLEDLRQRGVAVRGEMGPAWDAIGDVPWIAITGTNGKTTVTTLIHHILRAAGVDAPLCGNVGVSAAEVALARSVPAARRPEWLVVEMSSYQIEAAPEVAPSIGVWTTLTPDHLERHGTLDNYRAIKRHLLDQSRVRILNADDPDLRAHAASWDQAVWITAGPRPDLYAGIDPFLWIDEDGMVRGSGGPLFPAACLTMPGRHNRCNLLMATAVALHVGLGAAVIEAALRSFPGVPHRLERIREREGTIWYNDSKATNYDAAEVALRALEPPIVVLAGGQSKRGDPSSWLKELQRRAAAVVLFGAARDEFAHLLHKSGFPGHVQEVPGLEEAVVQAERLAHATGSTAVLLSPACASFDQYRDFEQRGDHFRQLVEAL